MKPLCFLLLLLFAAVTPLMGAVPQQAYFDLMGEADRAIADNRLDDAEQTLIRAIEMERGNPSNVLLMSNLGMVRFMMGKDSLAVTTLDAAHSLAPRSTTVLRNRAQVLSAIGELDRARADYALLIDLDSTAVTPRFHRGFIALRQGDMAQAVADFSRLREMAPDTLETHLAWGVLDMTLGQFDDAAREYTAVLKKEAHAGYYAERAFCYLMTDRLGEAADDIASGLSLDPMDADLYLYRSLLNKARYRIDDSKADARKALDLGADPERVKELLR